MGLLLAPAAPEPQIFDSAESMLHKPSSTVIGPLDHILDVDMWVIERHQK